MNDDREFPSIEEIPEFGSIGAGYEPCEDVVLLNFYDYEGHEKLISFGGSFDEFREYFLMVERTYRKIIQLRRLGRKAELKGIPFESVRNRMYAVDTAEKITRAFEEGDFDYDR